MIHYTHLIYYIYIYFQIQIHILTWFATFFNMTVSTCPTRLQGDETTDLVIQADPSPEQKRGYRDTWMGRESGGGVSWVSLQESWVNGGRFPGYWGDYMAAAQNVRSGSSPVPTHDPDLRSRPPIQTFRKDLIQTFDPDLWNDIMYWWVDVWSSDGCMLLGFLLCSYSPCQAAKQQTVVKPSCHASKLHLS